ncbi:MAG: enoyl-CoA hydratase/isomerase family protein [Proteobacteria bacterium]|nr:enoyl-CoA hydratase/isomerase family protein [Pseudomonadota bacterium]
MSPVNASVSVVAMQCDLRADEPIQENPEVSRYIQSPIKSQVFNAYFYGTHDMSRNTTAIEIKQHQEAIREITMNVPERRNALSIVMLNELKDAFSSTDNSTRVIVLSAAGSIFCAGGDLQELGRGEESDLQMDVAIGEVIEEIRNLPVPVIAAVEGACIGAGVDLLLACDLRVVAEDAYLEIPAVRLGLLYNPAGINRMHQRIGSTAVTRLLLLGDRVAARDAYHLGIISHLTSSGTSRTLAMTLASELCKGNAAAIDATKAYLRALENGNVNVQAWERTRRQLLGLKDRLKAVEERRKNTGGQKKKSPSE